MAQLFDIERHPKKVLEKIRTYAADLTKVEYQTESLNPLLQQRSVFMADIWECLEHGEIMDDHLHFEETGIYAKLVCHTGDGLIYVDLHLLKVEGKLRVLYATKEED